MKCSANDRCVGFRFLKKNLFSSPTKHSIINKLFSPEYMEKDYLLKWRKNNKKPLPPLGVSINHQGYVEEPLCTIYLINPLDMWLTNINHLEILNNKSFIPTFWTNLWVSIGAIYKVFCHHFDAVVLFYNC